MDVRSFVETIEAAQQRFLPCPGVVAGVDLRRDLSVELQRLETMRISEGAEPRLARNVSWDRAKVLQGLGYPIDFDWLHGPACALPRHA